MKLVGPLALIGLWILVSYTGVVSTLLLPRPDRVAQSFWTLFSSGEILSDLGATLLRWMAGLALGTCAGIPIGLLMGISKRVQDAAEALIDFFRSIPLMAMFPLFVIFLGVGEGSRIAISGWSTFLYVLVNTVYGVKHASPARRKVARVFHATWWQTFSKIIFPEALPHIMVGLRISVSMSLVLVVAAEMIMGGSTGVGKRIFDAALTYNTAEMYATIIVAGFLGYLSNRAFLAAEKRVVHWTGM